MCPGTGAFERARIWALRICAVRIRTERRRKRRGSPITAATGVFLLLSLGITPVAAEHQLADANASWFELLIPITVPLTHVEQGRRRHYVEECTGVILSDRPLRVLTAWHCFDGTLDLSRPAQVRVDATWHEARLIDSGDSMASDWAVLQVRGEFAQKNTLPVASHLPAVGTPLLMVGFSGDWRDANNNRLLSVDSDCEVIEQRTSHTASDCSATRGASGGAVMAEMEGELRLVGVISGADPEGARLFTPVSAFSTAAIGP